MNFFRGSAFFLCLFLTANAANAEIIYPEYKKLVGDQQLSNYVFGVGQGLAWANSALRTDGKNMLYCPPEAANFAPDDYIKVIDKKAKAVAALLGDKTLQITPIEYLLVRGMMDNYPCRGAR